MTNENYNEAKTLKTQISVNNEKILEISGLETTIEQETLNYILIVSRPSGIKVGSIEVPKTHLNTMLEAYKGELQQENETLEEQFEAL